MADRVFLGIAAAVAQVTTVQITGYDAATSYSLTVGGLAVTVPGTTDAAGTATALAAAWEARTESYFSGIAASASTDTVTLTGTAGIPFTVTASASGGTGTIGSPSTGTAATGPAHFSNAANWSGGAVPTTDDNIIFENLSRPLLFDLDQNSVAVDDIWVNDSFTGRIGLSAYGFTTGLDGAVDTSLPEYRDQYLDLTFDNAFIGFTRGPVRGASGAGSDRIRLKNSKAGASVLDVLRTAAVAENQGAPAVYYLAGNAGADVNVRSARAGIGLCVGSDTETGTFGDVLISDPTEGTRAFIGRGATYDAFRQYGGLSSIDSAATLASVEAEGGELVINGAFAVTALTASADARVIANNAPAAGAAIVTLNMADRCVVDVLQSRIARTVTTLNHNGGQLLADADVLTVTNYNQPAGRHSLTAAPV